MPKPTIYDLMCVAERLVADNFEVSTMDGFELQDFLEEHNLIEKQVATHENRHIWSELEDVEEGDTFFTSNMAQMRPELSYKPTSWAVGTIEGIEQEFRIYTNGKEIWAEDEDDHLCPKYIQAYFNTPGMVFNWRLIGE